MKSCDDVLVRTGRFGSTEAPERQITVLNAFQSIRWLGLRPTSRFSEFACARCLAREHPRVLEGNGLPCRPPAKTPMGRISLNGA